MPEVGAKLEAAIDWPVSLDRTCALQLVIRGRVARQHLRHIGMEIFNYEFKTRSSQLT